ncbi:flavodoxin [Bacillus phage vB_BcoS-136]|uniref:Flavodoxin n=1 Tax=Bacillus phage vB_BcoS-136 TaxID=2419619 RepID=A0A3G3BVM7_9CAUD|nr:flavodoxin [Bacillus phage vB_BcoS-136]AYP68319.1 flavodoxin [Bacillus phage vB_BcoS-136]
MFEKAIICYLSYSGNTKEVAELVEKTLLDNKINVDMHRIGSGETPDLSLYDIIFIGTFTWGKGQTPDEMKDFVLDVGYKPSNIAIFGTGDTQFGGDDLFCNANNRLSKFYNSEYDTLKIEQSPRGQQEKKVSEWTEGVISKWKSLN